MLKGVFIMGIVANKYEPKDIFRFIREWSELTQGEFGKTINRSEMVYKRLKAVKEAIICKRFLILLINMA